jgi:hypothetical protein
LNFSNVKIKLMNLLFIISLLLTSSVAVAQVSKGGREMGMKEIREPAVAGAFIPINQKFFTGCEKIFRKRKERENGG